MGVQSADVVYADVVLELLSGLASFLEEIGTKPDLLQMSFMRIFCQNLFYCYLSLGRSMDTQPHHTEATSPEQSYSLEILWKPLPKFVELIGGEVSSDIEVGLLAISIVDFNGLFLVVLGLTDVVVSFLKGAEFFFGFRILLFFTIK